MYKYLLSLLALSIAAPALAGGPLSVESSMLTVKKRAAADGTTQVSLVPAALAVPGDRIVMRLSYRNSGRAPIGDLVLSNPVPKGIVYRAPSAGSPAPELSVDGRTFGPLSSLRVGQRAATVEDVTQVRWRLASVPAGTQGQVSFEGVLK